MPSDLETTEYLSDPTVPSEALLTELAPEVPAPVREAMDAGASLAVQISGRKDSQAMLWLLAALCQRNGWDGQCYGLHADLGGAEWLQTRPHVERVCSGAGAPLRVIGREGGLTGRILRAQKEAGRHRPPLLAER